MKKFLIWLGILILAVALGVLGYKAPGPLENLSNNYRLGLMVGGIVFLLMDFVWAFLKVRGWWKRREEAGKEEWDEEDYEEDEEDYEEGEQSVGWGAMPVLIPQQPVSPTPPAPSAPVSPPPQSPTEEEEGKGNAWGKWLIAGAVVLAIVVGVGLAAITSGSGPSQSTVIAGRPAATQPGLPTRQAVSSTGETDSVTKLTLLLSLVYIGLGLFALLGYTLTRVTMEEEDKITYTVAGYLVTIPVQVRLAVRVDPFHQLSSVLYAWVNSRLTTRPKDQIQAKVGGMVVSQGLSYPADEYTQISEWRKRLNTGLTERLEGRPISDPDVAEQILTVLQPTEKQVSINLTELLFPQDVIAPALSSYVESKREEARRLAGMEEVEAHREAQRRHQAKQIEEDPLIQATARVNLAMTRLGIKPGSQQAEELLLRVLQQEERLLAQETERRRADAEYMKAEAWRAGMTAVQQVAQLLSEYSPEEVRMILQGAVNSGGKLALAQRFLQRGEA